MDDIQIPTMDQDRIDLLVVGFRHSIENIYRTAYIQGQIDLETENLKKLKEKLAA